MRVLLVALVASALLVGCEDHRAGPTATPTGTIDTNPLVIVRPSPSSTPTPHPRCAYHPVRERDGYLLTLTPREPKRGEAVQVVGRGIEPGDYQLSVGIYASEMVARLFRVTVGERGTFSATFTMPRLGAGCAVVHLGDLGADPWLSAPAWSYDGRP